MFHKLGLLLVAAACICSGFADSGVHAELMSSHEECSLYSLRKVIHFWELAYSEWRSYEHPHRF